VGGDSTLSGDVSWPGPPAVGANNVSVSAYTLCACAPDGQTLHLECAAGGTITAVDSALLGTPVSTCGAMVPGSCNGDSAKAKATVSAACLGKTSCALPCDIGHFNGGEDSRASCIRPLHCCKLAVECFLAGDDPCVGTPKRVAVQVTCSTLQPSGLPQSGGCAVSSATAAYALADYPRFHTPAWGPTPIPAGAGAIAGAEENNGFDYNNDWNHCKGGNQTAAGRDTYVFLLGDDMDDWQSARMEFLKLTGPIPLLPDFAFGVWFQTWAQYTEDEAKTEIGHWQDTYKLPIDVWGMDMNWCDLLLPRCPCLC
jgi:hypothetical protein